MTVAHLTAHVAAGSEVDLCQPIMARRVWVFLRRAFPIVLCAELMPNHGHVIVVVDDVDWARHRMAKALAGAVRGCGRYTWEHLPDAQVLVNAGKIRRHVRYVTLNPCRAKIVRDPLEWPWTTHRDLVGGVAAPWVSPEYLASVLHERREGLEFRLHRYISSDRDVDVKGTALPRLLEHQDRPTVAVDDIRRATLAATRGFEGDVRRRGYARDLFVALARRQGWQNSLALADQCGLSRQGLARCRPVINTHDLNAAALCLGDPRLLAGPWRRDQVTAPTRAIGDTLRQFRAESSPAVRAVA